MEVDVLPRWERLLYSIGGISSIGICLFSLYIEGQANLAHLETQKGIKWLGGEKDFPDLEWSNFLNFLPTLAPLLLGHVILGLFLYRLRLNIWHQKCLRLVFDVFAIAPIFGVKATLLCVVESLVMYLVTFQRHVLVAWGVALFFTTTLNVEWIINKQLLSTGYSLNNNVTFFVAISYLHIRLISASIELIKDRNASVNLHMAKDSKQNIPRHKKSGTPLKSDKDILNYGKYSQTHSKATIIDFLSYIFYLPIFFQGPIVTFDEFFPQLTAFYQSNKHHYNGKKIAKKLLKIILVAGFIEFQFHFMYLTAVQMNWRLVRQMSMPSIIGLGVWQGQFFHMKYLCFFGIGSIFSTLDGLLPPPPPACICWVYSFSDIWKHFDVGLHNFVKKYIYIPCGGSKAGFPRQICGSVLAFAFICFWHGAGSAVMVWCCGNMVIIVLENSAIRFERSELGLRLKSAIGPVVEQRLRGLITVPCYLASSLQVMYFFFSMGTGRAMVDKLVWEASWKNLLLEYIGFYLAIQNAMYIRPWAVERQRS